MRSAVGIGLGAAAVIAVVLAALPADAGKRRRGRIVKIEHKRSEMVRVPGGKFFMGVNNRAERQNLHAACRRQLGIAAQYYCMGTVFVFPTRWALIGTGFSLSHTRRFGRRVTRPITGRTVYVSSFEIDRFEVTVGEYRKCVSSGACGLTPLVTGDRRYLRAGLPMVNVNYQDAVDYCTWRKKRLPTEAEWEKAARGTKRWRWPWGNHDRKDGHNHGKPDSNTVMLLRGQQLPISHKVYPAFRPDASDGAKYAVRPGFMRWSESPYGAYDMAGNVSEWTADWFSTEGYRGLPSFNPHRKRAQAGHRYRSVRGGSWADPKYMGRTYMRSHALPGSRSAHRGFRCARDIAE